MVNILSGKELFGEMKDLGIEAHFLSKDHCNDQCLKGHIYGVILHGIYYLDNGDGIKSQLFITPSGRVLCKDKDTIPSSIFHIVDGKIELLVIKSIVNSSKEYDNIIKRLKYEYVSSVNNIINGDDEYYIKEYI